MAIEGNGDFHFFPRCALLTGKSREVQANLREPERTLADNYGNVIRFSRSYIRKYLMLRHLEARGVEPLFPALTSSKIEERLYPRGFADSNPSWKWLDGAGCY